VQSLSNAKKVHAYVRDADDTIEWIEEKDLLVSSEDYGHDLFTVQALIVKQEGFEVCGVVTVVASDLFLNHLHSYNRTTNTDLLKF